MLNPKEVTQAIDLLKLNRGLGELLTAMGWRDISPLAEAVKLRMVPQELGRAEDLIHAYSIQARNDFSLFPLKDTEARTSQRDRQVQGLVNLVSKCTDDFIIFYAFPITQTIPRPHK